MQNNDQEIKSIKDSIRNTTKIDSKNFANLNVEIEGDVLFMKEENKRKPIIPMDLRYDFVASTQLDPLVGHLQRLQLKSKIKIFVYVKDLKRIILELIKLCM